MLEMSWITAILQLYSQVADLFGSVIVKRINISLFDLLVRFHYILNLPRKYSKNGGNLGSLLYGDVSVMKIVEHAHCFITSEPGLFSFCRFHHGFIYIQT